MTIEKSYINSTHINENANYQRDANDAERRLLVKYGSNDPKRSEGGLLAFTIKKKVILKK